MAGTTAIATGLASATVYWVRVRSRNGGVQSAWGLPERVVTAATSAPGSVVLVSPTDADTGGPLRGPLVWRAATQAVRYDVQVASDAGFGTLLFDGSVVGDTTASISPALPLDTQVWWRVRATNGLGDGGWSAARSFTTAEADLDAPVLIGPNDQEEARQTRSALQWNSVSGAWRYRVQYVEIRGGWDATPDWSNPDYDDDTSGRSLLRTFQTGSRYAWRVQALGFGGSAGPWSATWRFSTTGIHPDAPAHPTLTEPRNAATNVPIPPTLAWDALPGVTDYQVQVATSSNTFTFENSPIYDARVTGTSATLEGVSLNTNTFYYWRVRGVNDFDGQWSSAFRFRTASQIVERPTLVLPAGGASGVSVLPTFEWTIPSGANATELQVSATPDFADPVIRRSHYDGTTTTHRELVVLQGDGQTYYWRMNARTGSLWSAWTAPRTFTTAAATNPGAPTILSPTPGGTIRYKDNTGAPYVTWLPSPDDADYYQYQFSVDGSFTDTPAPTSASTSLYWLGDNFPDQQFGQAPTETAIRVRAVSDGGPGPWTTVAFSISVVADAMPLFDAQHEPTHGSRIAGLGGTLRWFAAGHAQTDVQVSAASDFSTVAASASNVATVGGFASAAYAGLSPDTRYFWRVRPSGGAWSSTFFFDTSDGVPDAAPELISPFDAATNLTETPSFEWQAVAEAQTYQAQVSTDPTFATTVADVSTGNTTMTTSPLALATTHYWRVRAVGGIGAGPWSDVYSFTTQLPPPPAPTLRQPAANATSVGLRPALTWTIPAGITTVSYQISTASDFSSTVAQGTNAQGGALVTTSAPIGRSILRPPARAEARASSLPTGRPRPPFTTQSYTAPAAPTLTAPAHEATDVTLPRSAVLAGRDRSRSLPIPDRYRRPVHGFVRRQRRRVDPARHVRHGSSLRLL